MTTLRSDSASPASQEQFGGLTKREYIATHIMAGLASLPATGAANHRDRADKAVRMADALIEALNRESAT